MSRMSSMQFCKVWHPQVEVERIKFWLRLNWDWSGKRILVGSKLDNQLKIDLTTSIFDQLGSTYKTIPIKYNIIFKKNIFLIKININKAIFLDMLSVELKELILKTDTSFLQKRTELICDINIVLLSRGIFFFSLIPSFIQSFNRNSFVFSSSQYNDTRRIEES